VVRSYIIDGGCSDDGFEYFRCWLISRGKKLFYKAKSKSGSLITLVKENEGYMNLKDFGMWQSMHFKNSTGEDSYIDYNQFVTNDEISAVRI
jgi:hypothetical protein